MSVDLEPVELGFRRPFTQEVSQSLSLHNSNSDPVAFKVKTTAPKQYCVRPNSGRIEPGSSVEVQVLLQAMKEDLPPDAKCKDKFLVQSVAITADQEFSNVSQLWSHMEKTAKSMIQEKKIRVFFLPPHGGAVSTPAAARTSVNGAPAEDSPAPDVYTPERGSTAPPKSESKPDTARDQKQEKSSAGIVAALPTSAEELKTQLADAKATIARLTEQQGLRQRKGGEKKEASASAAPRLDMQQAPAGGVPVPVVAGLCLFSFLLAYLLF